MFRGRFGSVTVLRQSAAARCDWEDGRVSRAAPDETVARPADGTPLRSFKRRTSRVTATQADALDRLWPSLGVPSRPALDLAGCSGAARRWCWRSGSAWGSRTSRWLRRSRTDVLAVDVHTPGLGGLLRDVDARGLTNVRVADGDANTLLPLLPAASVHEVRIFFPDPWPKTRHWKRRLVDSAFLALVAGWSPEGACTSRPTGRTMRTRYAAWWPSTRRTTSLRRALAAPDALRADRHRRGPAGDRRGRGPAVTCRPPAALPAVVDVLPDAVVVDVAQRALQRPRVSGGQVGRGGVRPRLLGVARAGDDGAHPGLVDDPAQGELGGGRALRA